MKIKSKCPCCGADISGFIQSQISSYLLLKQAEKMREKLHDNLPVREKLNRESAQRLSEWRKNNPDSARKLGDYARSKRTAKTFKKQSATIRDTISRKKIRFAELLNAAISAGTPITPELKSQLLLTAAEQIRIENKKRAGRSENRNAPPQSNPRQSVESAPLSTPEPAAANGFPDADTVTP